MSIYQVPVESLISVADGKVVGIIGSSDFASFDDIQFLISNMKDSTIIISGFNPWLRRNAERFADSMDVVLIEEELAFGQDSLNKFVESCGLLVTCGLDAKIETVKRIASANPTIHSSIVRM